jgi:peptidyl-prolyl cis-trans isomerase C
MTFAQTARLLIALVAAIALPAMAQNLAIVNGKPIPSNRADTMIKQLKAQGQPESPELRAMVREELINREILMQEANRRGVTKDPDVQNQVEIARQSIAIRAMVQDYLQKNPVTDADVQAEYDKFKDQSADKEYNASHILVESEEQAKGIIEKLKGGAKFEELAKQSKDPGSAANGGSLDWAPPNAFVKPFSDAMVALEKGQVTQTPVQTQYGYHVIKLDDVRDAKLPELEEVKPQITESLQQQKLQAFQEDLRKKAKIQ